MTIAITAIRYYYSKIHFNIKILVNFEWGKMLGYRV